MSIHTVRTALITGASSGIGAAFAWKLAVQGYDLVLVARREARLAQLAAELQQQFSVNAEILVADLSQPAALQRVERHITELNTLELLVNNAGFGVPGNFAGVALDRYLAMIQLHILASTHLSQAALPGMIARGKGGLIYVSSLGAFIPRPGDAVYCATKSYLVTFAQALQGELKGSGIQVQALCPGFVPTEFLDQPEYKREQVKDKIPRMLWMPAEAVVAESLKALQRGRVICIPGFKNKIIVTLARALPGTAGLLLGVFNHRLRSSGQSHLAAKGAVPRTGGVE